MSRSPSLGIEEAGILSRRAVITRKVLQAAARSAACEVSDSFDGTRTGKRSRIMLSHDGEAIT